MVYIIFIVTTITEFVLLNLFWVLRENESFNSAIGSRQELVLDAAGRQMENYIRNLMDITDSVYFDILKDNGSDWDEKQRLSTICSN